jgi:hypothetical protein
MTFQELTNLVKEIDQKVDVIYMSMIGDPTDNNKPGCRLKQDRLEQSFASFKRHYYVLLPLVITAVISLLVKAFV